MIKGLAISKNVKKKILKINMDKNKDKYIGLNLLKKIKDILGTSISSIDNKNTSISSINIINEINSLEATSPDKIIKLIKIIGQHNKPANYIKELSNEIIVSGGNNFLFFYNYLPFKKINKYKIENINIYEKVENQLIVFSNENNNNILTFKQNNFPFKLDSKKIEEEIKMRVYFMTITNFCLICNEEGIFQKSHIFIKLTQKREYKIINKNYFGGIQINENIFSFISNKKIKKGEDKIIIYNSSSQNYKENNNYSFNLYQKNLCLIIKENESNTKLLLYACKKIMNIKKMVFYY